MKMSVLACVVASITISLGASVRAAEVDTVLFLGDYQSFNVGPNRSWRACERTCNNDPRCRAWTFIKGTRQCRLKSKVGLKMSNSCCVSGVRSAPRVPTKQTFCADYARQAVDSVGVNRAQRCGYNGESWADNYSAHYRWCLRVDRQKVEEENLVRRRMLDQCQQFVLDQQSARCDHYARISVQQARSAEAARCGYGGSRWMSSYEKHFSDCQNGPVGALEDAATLRQKDLNRCFDIGGRSDSECKTYAKLALRLYRRGQASDCKFGRDQRWSDNQRRHYQWCLAARPGERRAEAVKRQELIRQCERRLALNKICGPYVKRAVKQAQIASKLQCNFTGRLWSLSGNNHRQFCTESNERARLAAQRKRNDQLARCEQLIARRNLCTRYVNQAVATINRAAELGCRVSGNRWSRQPNVHDKFCSQASEELLNEESEARKELMAICKVRAKRRNRCRTYGEDAAKQARRAFELGCGVVGERWSESVRDHQQFCFETSPQAMKTESDARRKQLVVCERLGERRQGCQVYAREAVDQARVAARLDCEVLGQRWSQDAEEQIRFCLGASNQDLALEANARRRRLSLCEARGGQTMPDSACDQYARRAIRAQEINRNGGCGFTRKARWSSSYDKHLQFCRDKGSAASQSQDLRRHRALRRCADRRGFRLDF